MNHILARILAALLTFSFGLFLSAACRRSHQLATVAKPPTPARAVSPTTFQGTGIVDMFMEDYRRPSDGVIVRFHCSDRASEAKALLLVQNERTTPLAGKTHVAVRNERTTPLVEKTDVVDAGGTRIGERVVWDSRGSVNAGITWNERARLFSINAQSLQDALTFEKSRAWEPAGCWDARSWP